MRLCLNPSLLFMTWPQKWKRLTKFVNYIKFKKTESASSDSTANWVWQSHESCSFITRSQSILKQLNNSIQISTRLKIAGYPADHLDFYIYTYKNNMFVFTCIYRCFHPHLKFCLHISIYIQMRINWVWRSTAGHSRIYILTEVLRFEGSKIM